MDTSMDTSADASFVSIDDDSVIEGSISPLSRTSRHGRISDITDPFVTGSSLRKEVHTDNDDGDESDITASEVDNVRCICASIVYKLMSSRGYPMSRKTSKSIPPSGYSRRPRYSLD